MPEKNQNYSSNMYMEYVKNVEYDKKGNVIKLELTAKDDFNFSYDVVDKIAVETPDRLAILWVNDKGAEKRITFGELKTETDKVASFFMSLGIKKGDYVMVMLKRHYEYWYTYLALHKIGAVTIPATTMLQVKDMVYRIKAADVTAVICTAEGDIALITEKAEQECGVNLIKVLARGHRDSWVNFDEGKDGAPAFKRPTGKDAPVGKDISILFFTSGTTGMPKMVIHDFFYPLCHICTAAVWHNAVDGGLHITVADTGWAKTAWGKMYSQWLCGSAQFIFDHDKFHADVMLRMIEKYKVTTFCAPPTIYRFFIKEDLTAYDFSNLKYVTVAGEALNAEVYNQFLNATGLKLKEGYGQTENTIAVLNQIYDEPKPGSMGKPNPVFEIFISDENGNPTETGVNGEIVIRADRDNPPIGMFREYYKDKELTDSVWHDGLYHTGDMAWRDEDGYFWFVGRTDDIIKSSGYRIGPFEVESVIMEHPAVLECAVTGADDEIRGQVVKATIVLANGYEKSEALAKEIQNYVKTHTAPYKYPRIVEFVDALPKTISGKIRRTEIRDEGK
ncbi:MAG: AMP-binding protein [Oscillospiraceae bacterium]|nr:AMP-binding protein [Oscillospiraceae bacterium]